MFVATCAVFLGLATLISANCGPNVPCDAPSTCTTTVCRTWRGDSGQGNRDEPPAPQGKPGKRGPKGTDGVKGEKGDPCQCDIADEEAVAALRKELQELRERYEGRLPTNCSEYREGAGDERYDVVQIYPLKTIGDLTPFIVNCAELENSGEDGWIVIQRRMDGSTDFYRNWESYARGFGSYNGEFWIGLRTLHKLTATENYKLRIDLKYWDGTNTYAEYRTFRVGNEASKFILTSTGFSGNSTRDNMAHHSGRKFSTYDADNDDHSGHCAQIYKGAWWYGACHDSNLNGLYFKDQQNNNKGVWWDGYSRALPFTEMRMKHH